MKIPGLFFYAGVVAGVFCCQLNAQIVMYDSLIQGGSSLVSYPSGISSPDGMVATPSDEIGNEIQLAQLGTGTVGALSIQYSAQNLDGGQTVDVRVYLPDGQKNPLGFNTPGTILYDSHAVPLGTGNGLETVTPEGVRSGIR